MESQTKKILICADSFGEDDPGYPGLHFSQKIANSFPIIDWRICNMSIRGGSNRLIAQQLLQGLAMEPDFVILSFTAPTRQEVALDEKPRLVPRSLNPEDITNWNKQRFDYGCIPFLRSSTGKMIDPTNEVIDLNNILMAAYCLEILLRRGIGYCWSEGGLPEFDYAGNYMSDPFVDHMARRIPLNLWNHNVTNDPCFHVTDDKVQEAFANMCLNHILDSLDV